MHTASSRTLMQSVGRLAIAATVLVGLTLGPAPHAAAVTSGTYETDTYKAANAQRAKAKLTALKGNACLDRYAESQASKMAKAKRIYHQDLNVPLTQCKLRMVGENVAYGYSSGSAVVAAWMKSPGHKANIMNKSYRITAVGAVKGTDGRWYVAQVYGLSR